MKQDSAWNNFFQYRQSERDSRLGKKSREYIVSKYLQLFTNTFANDGNLSFLELGAGRGEITKSILKNKLPFLKTYMATELTPSGVRALKKLQIPVKQMDAQNLTFKKNAFDVVCAFDVMHHVPNPKKMAQEMTRVAKRHIFLIEANGLSIARRILEQTRWYKTLGENSYFPWQYLSFFPREQFSSLTIRPFLFVPPKIPLFLIDNIPLISDTLEKFPLLKWQCSGVVISGVKN